MGKHISFATTAWTAAQPSSVYRLLIDGATWPTWSPIGSFELAEEGPDGGETVGALRVFKTGTVKSRERIVGMEPDKAFQYSAISGLPVRNHQASVDLREERGGTAITWHEDFEAKFGAGWFLARFLRRFVQRCADGLAAHAAGSRTSANN
jgi:hypothetical protein